MAPWDFFNPQEGSWYRWRLNGGIVFLCRKGTHWHYAVKAKNRDGLDDIFDGPELDEEPHDLDQSIAISSGKTVALRPTMINKPIVIDAINSLQILRNQEVRLSIDLPVSYHFELENGETLCRLNTFNLPKTWFGDTSSGIFCFSWPTHLIPSLADPTTPQRTYGSMLSCQILIRNSAKSILELKHFAVYTEMLDIRVHKGRMVTDTVLLEGLSDGNLKMSLEPNTDARKDTVLYHASLGHTELLVKRGVSFLRSITGIT